MANWSDLSFNFSDINYIYQLDTLRDRSEANATEVENARLGEATLDVLTGNLNTELVASRQGEIDLVTNLGNYVQNASLTVDFDLNGFKAINVANGTASSDLVNLSQATALILGGASPANINITDISNGTATTGQRIVAGATSPEGEDNVPLTMDIGTLSANHVVGANSGASALVEKNLTNIDAGTLTALTQVQVKVGQDGLEDYDSDLELAMASLYMYDNG